MRTHLHLADREGGIRLLHGRWQPLLDRQAAIRARLHDLKVPIEGEESVQHPETAEPPFPPPQQINGFTAHGQERVEGRDGHGVSATARCRTPSSIRWDHRCMRRISTAATYTYVGKDADSYLP